MLDSGIIRRSKGRERGRENDSREQESMAPVG